MTALILSLAAILFLCSIAGAVPMRMWESHPSLQMAHWGLSFIGQSFALPLAMFSGALLALIALAETPRPWSLVVAAAALLLSIANHLRNHHAGRQLLAAVAESDSMPPFEPVPILSGLLPSRGRRKGVRRVADIAYGAAEDRRNLLDVYLPEAPSAEPLPVIIQIHGGAWTMGEKETQGQPLLYYLASRGWMGVAINYRLGPKHRLPEIFGDVLRAIAWVKQHAAQYGGDARFVAVTGGSAGGHLASLCALMPNNEAFKPGFEDLDTSVSAAIPVYGRYDFIDRSAALGKGRDWLIRFFEDNVMHVSLEEDPDAWHLASPVAQAHIHAPPFFIIGTRHDSMIPFKESRFFAESLSAVSDAEVVYAELPFGQHGFDFLNHPLTEYKVRAVERFLHGVLQRGAVSDIAANPV